jgi:hypothetical protein
MIATENLEKVVIEISSLLKDGMRRTGQLSCQLKESQVSTRGGWCAKDSARNSSKHKTDTDLATALSRFLKNKMVASFGDGPGVYKELLLKMNEVKGYDAFDGAPYVNETTNGQVEFLDLSVPVYHLSQYDWVVSLEVAEHISAEFEDVYIGNLLRHAREGIVISWAKVGQSGHSHVNCRNFDYVKDKMEAQGFKYDFNATKILKSSSSFHWFKSNIIVFYKS